MNSTKLPTTAELINRSKRFNRDKKKDVPHEYYAHHKTKGFRLKNFNRLLDQEAFLKSKEQEVESLMQKSEKKDHESSKLLKESHFMHDASEKLYNSNNSSKLKFSMFKTKILGEKYKQKKPKNSDKIKELSFFHNSSCNCSECTTVVPTTHQNSDLTKNITDLTYQQINRQLSASTTKHPLFKLKTNHMITEENVKTVFNKFNIHFDPNQSQYLNHKSLETNATFDTDKTKTIDKKFKFIPTVTENEERNQYSYNIFDEVQTVNLRKEAKQRIEIENPQLLFTHAKNVKNFLENVLKVDNADERFSTLEKFSFSQHDKSQNQSVLSILKQIRPKRSSVGSMSINDLWEKSLIYKVVKEGGMDKYKNTLTKLAIYNADIEKMKSKGKETSKSVKFSRKIELEYMINLQKEIAKKADEDAKRQRLGNKLKTHIDSRINMGSNSGGMQDKLKNILTDILKEDISNRISFKYFEQAEKKKPLKSSTNKLKRMQSLLDKLV